MTLPSRSTRTAVSEKQVKKLESEVEEHGFRFVVSFVDFKNLYISRCRYCTKMWRFLVSVGVWRVSVGPERRRKLSTEPGFFSRTS